MERGVRLLGMCGALALLGLVGCTEEELAGSCTDRVQNADETDVDCGGRCAPCGDGLLCGDDGDCRSGLCDGETGRCAPGACDDGLLNGDESDVDCGGLACAPCPGGSACARGADCMSRSCASGICTEARCDDGRLNGTETDIDCGGATCPKCEAGAECRAGADCTSLLCTGGVCADSSCTDALANGDETDVDCGGPDCRACLDGQTCATGDDCANGVCGGEGRCVSSTCGDGVKNGQESDVDCGRVCDALCADGLACRSGPDCASLVCDLLNDVCAAPSCDDDVLNGAEADVDCGGACGGCQTGQACTTGDDCVDRVCGEDGKCAAPSCTDGVVNGEETDADCGGSECGPCGDGLGCARSRDCTSLVCDAVALTCSPPSCTDAVTNGDETDVDCGGPDCDACANFRDCEEDDDCVSGNCSRNVCAPADCAVFGRSGAYVGCSETETTPTCPDIGSTGTDAGFDATYTNLSVTLPFGFGFHGATYSEAWLHPSGTMSFDSGGLYGYGEPDYSCMPYTSYEYSGEKYYPEAFIAAYWHYMDLYGAGNVYYETRGTAPNRTFHVQWETFSGYWYESPVDVRLVLREGSDVIDVCYVDTTLGYYDAGEYASAGVQGDPASSLQYSCNSASLTEGLHLRYYPRD